MIKVSTDYKKMNKIIKKNYNLQKNLSYNNLIIDNQLIKMKNDKNIILSAIMIMIKTNKFLKTKNKN